MTWWQAKIVFPNRPPEKLLCELFVASEGFPQADKLANDLNVSLNTSDLNRTNNSALTRFKEA
jgi:hypothetical protein